MDIALRYGLHNIASMYPRLGAGVSEETVELACYENVLHSGKRIISSHHDITIYIKQ